MVNKKLYKCPDCHKKKAIIIDPPILTTNKENLIKQLEEAKNYTCYSCVNCGHLWVVEKKK